MKEVIHHMFTGVTKKQRVDFGLVTILVAFFLAIFLKQIYFVKVAFVLTLITIIIPIVFHPFATVWLGLSKILGVISTRILLCIVFFIIVTPVGLFRRALKKDTMKVRQFKKGTESVMADRDHLYTAADLFDTF